MRLVRKLGSWDIRTRDWVYQIIWHWPVSFWGEWDGPPGAPPEGYHLHVWCDNQWLNRLVPNRLAWNPWPTRAQNPRWVGKPAFEWWGWGPLEVRRFDRKIIEHNEAWSGYTPPEHVNCRCCL